MQRLEVCRNSPQRDTLCRLERPMGHCSYSGDRSHCELLSRLHSFDWYGAATPSVMDQRISAPSKKYLAHSCLYESPVATTSLWIVAFCPAIGFTPVLCLQAQGLGLGLRQFRRVYDLEVKVSDSPVTDINHAINQINNTLLALSHIAAQSNPSLAQAYLGAAVLASREQGSGDNFVFEIFQKALPGKSLPTPLSPEDLAKKQKEINS
ncbi:hypothetical protein PS880_04451 [Pseudomonas fluorescens]|uniref:Uncharacterized protein n=1 Tax=Pseudomonas fluorescens TaxID=294 RepID=A0A5E7N847_PSEFL|nr:hypothetical protein PS880_04451 [Pseudomonas fluorescens]